MEYPVEAPEFGGRRVTVQTATLASGPKVLVDGVPVAKQPGNVFPVPGANGQTVELRLKNGLFDPVPVVDVAGRPVRLAPPLAWHEYVVACLPVLLVFVGGALGGALGGAAAYVNLGLFRSTASPAARYGLSLAVTAGAVAVFFALATLISGAVRR